MTLSAIARKHVQRHSRTQSFETIHRIYVEAAKAVGPMRGGGGSTEMERLAAKARHGAKVSAEFHRRLKEAGVRVEGALNESSHRRGRVSP